MNKTIQKTCFLILLACVVLWLTACLWPGPEIIPDPLPAAPDTCQNYEVETEPPFIGGFIWADGAATTGPRIIVVWALSDTLAAGESVAESLKTLLQQRYPQYEHAVFVNSTDDRKVFFVTRGTDDENILRGKMYIRYNGARFQFDVETQMLQTIGACTCEELMGLIQDYGSLSIISWVNMDCDSIQYNDMALAVIEADSCKAGKQWLDFRFNPYQMPDSIIQLAQDAGWNFVGENANGTTMDPALFWLDTFIK